jgi:hypothetical protein
MSTSNNYRAISPFSPFLEAQTVPHRGREQVRWAIIEMEIDHG